MSPIGSGRDFVLMTYAGAGGAERMAARAASGTYRSRPAIAADDTGTANDTRDRAGAPTSPRAAR